MAFPDATTLAPAYGLTLDNKALSVQAGNLPRKGALLAQYDPAKTDVEDYVPRLFLAKEQVGAELGWGFPAHRMAKNWDIYGAAVPMWVVPVPEADSATKSTRTLTLTVTTALAGSIPLYIGDDKYPVGVTAGMAVADIATAVAAKINADQDAVFVATADAGVVTLVAKAGGTFANDYLVETAYDPEDAMPGGVTMVIAQTVAGATDPDITDALNGMGTGSESNMGYFTDGVTSNGLKTADLQACSTWNGIGNQPVGNYAPGVQRPMRFLSVDTTAGSGGFDAMKAISDANTYDRTNAIVGAPDHKRHPVEIACEILGAGASMAQAHPHVSYVGVPLQGHVGASANRWTKDDTTRDTAIKAGISTTKVVDGTLVIDGLVTMYRPSNVAPAHNLYRSFRNIALNQNITSFHRSVWELAKNKTIVLDTAELNSEEKPYCMDVDGAKDLNNLWADQCQRKAWIYDAGYTKKTQKVSIRDLANGFDHILKVVYSAEGVVSNTTVQGDIALAAITG